MSIMFVYVPLVVNLYLTLSPVLSPKSIVNQS